MRRRFFRLALSLLLCAVLLFLNACAAAPATVPLTASPTPVDPTTQLAPLSVGATYVPGYNLIVADNCRLLMERVSFPAPENGKSLDIIGAYADGETLNILVEYGDYVRESLGALKSDTHAYADGEQLAPSSGGNWSMMETASKTRIWLLFSDNGSNDIKVDVKGTVGEFTLSADKWRGASSTLGHKLNAAGREVTCVMLSGTGGTSVGFYSGAGDIVSFGNAADEKLPAIVSPRGVRSRLTAGETSPRPSDLYTLPGIPKTYYGGKVELPCIQVRQDEPLELRFTVPETRSDLGIRLGTPGSSFEAVSVEEIEGNPGHYTLNFNLFPEEGQQNRYDLVTGAKLYFDKGEGAGYSIHDELIWGVNFAGNSSRNNLRTIGYTFKDAKPGDELLLRWNSMVVEMAGPWEFDVNTSFISR